MIPRSLSFPPARIATDWLARLTPSNPPLILAGFMTLLRVEVLIETPAPRPLNRLTRSLLLAVRTAHPPTVAGINRLLQLGEERTATALLIATRLGLLDRSDDGFALSKRGQEALANGIPAGETRRIRLVFRDGAFIPWPDAGPLTAVDAVDLDRELQGARLAESAFAPSDDGDRAGSPAGPGARLVRSDDWRSIPIESECVVAVVLGRDSDSVAVSEVDPSVWALPAKPTLTLTGNLARNTIPEIFDSPRLEDLQAAWAGWVQARSVPADDLSACRLTVEGNRLVVEVPASLSNWLREQRGDLFAGQTWVWIGEGWLRRPVVLDVRPSG